MNPYDVGSTINLEFSKSVVCLESYSYRRSRNRQTQSEQTVALVIVFKTKREQVDLEPTFWFERCLPG